jgi:hypothetical protein
MPGTGASTAGILTRRLASGGQRRWHAPHFETFCADQVQRIERIANARLRRVREARRKALAADKYASEQLIVRGNVGSDAHPADDEPIELL